jgi:hypothetical protein
MGLPEVEAIWPQEFRGDRLGEDGPEVIVFDSWLVAGFRKVYRESAVAGLVDEVIAGGFGYHEVGRFQVRYLGRRYFAWLDPEHDVELIVVEKRREQRSGW